MANRHQFGHAGEGLFLKNANGVEAISRWFPVAMNVSRYSLSEALADFRPLGTLHDCVFRNERPKVAQQVRALLAGKRVCFFGAGLFGASFVACLIDGLFGFDLFAAVFGRGQ